MIGSSRQSQEFLTPQTISYIIILNHYLQNQQNQDAIDPFGLFLSEKFMNLDKEIPADNYKIFGEIIEHQTRNIEGSKEYIEAYYDQILKIDELNKLFQFLAVTLKNIRLQRTSKVENGNIMDIFIRRCYINFQKHGFNDIVKLFDQFTQYKDPEYKPSKLQLNQFAVDNQIQQLSSHLDNFANLDDFGMIENKIEFLQSVKQNDKFYYLKAKNAAVHGAHEQAFDNSHKYFDKQLSNLFQIIPEQGHITQSKVHHSVLNKAILNFEMRYYDEAVRGLSEALRLAQNNNDNESINYCLIFLYQITGILGRHEDAIEICEHALQHAVKIQNPLLQLYSCINYQHYHQIYDISYDKEGLRMNELYQKHIYWNEQMNFAIEKLEELYEQNMGNKMLDRISFYDIPISIKNLSYCNAFIDLKVPQMAVMVYNSRKQQFPQTFDSFKCINYILELIDKIYDYDPYKALDLLQSICDKQKVLQPRIKFYLYMICLRSYLDRSDTDNATYMLDFMEIQLKELRESYLESKYMQCQILLNIKSQNYDQAYYQICDSKESNEDNGYEMELLARDHIHMGICKLKTEQYEDAVKEFDKVIKMSKKKQQLKELKNLAKIYTSYCLMFEDLEHVALDQIQRVEEQYLYNLSTRTQAQALTMKAIVQINYSNKTDHIHEEYLKEYKKIGLKSAISTLNKALQLHINLGCIEEIRDNYHYQAMVYNELDLKKHREAASYYFLESLQYLNAYNKQTFWASNTYKFDDSSLILIQRVAMEVFPRLFQIIPFDQEDIEIEEQNEDKLSDHSFFDTDTDNDDSDSDIKQNEEEGKILLEEQ